MSGLNKDDITRIAREAGFVGFDGDNGSLRRFAALVAAAEREKLKHELLTLEKWKGMALAKDGDGRTVQEVEREARAREWQGLTDEEMSAAWSQSKGDILVRLKPFARAIEAKLKAKNAA